MLCSSNDIGWVVTISDEPCWSNLPFIHSTTPWPLLPPGQFITCMRSDFVFAAQKNHTKSLFPVIYIQQQTFLRNVSHKIFQQMCRNRSENSNGVSESRNTPWIMSVPELTDYIFIWINCSWTIPLALLMHNWHSTSNLSFLSLFYWEDKCSMLNQYRNPLTSCIWAPMCLFIRSSACTVICFAREHILTPGRRSSYYCLLLRTQIDFSLASMKRSRAWTLIDHLQHALHSDKRKTLRKPETAKPGLSAEGSARGCLQLLPGFLITTGSFFFWLIHMENGLDSTKNSRVSSYKMLD